MSLIPLIIYGVLAAGALFVGYEAWTGFVTKVSEPRVQAQMKHDEGVIAIAKAAQKAAEDQRDHALSDTAACIEEAASQSAEIDKWKARSDANVASAKAARVQAQQAAAAAAPKIAELQAAAAAKPQLMSCQAELDKTKTVLRDALAARRQPTKDLPK